MSEDIQNPVLKELQPRFFRILSPARHMSFVLKLHTLQLSLKQINKILGQIEGYLFFWPFCSGKKDM